MAISLPAWARRGEQNPGRLEVVHVDADLAYPALLSELGVDEADYDQYWLEVAYQCMKLDLQVAMRRFGFEIRIHDPGKKWAQAKFKQGKGAQAAARGLEAREHYRRMRGFLPG